VATTLSSGTDFPATSTVVPAGAEGTLTVTRPTCFCSSASSSDAATAVGSKRGSDFARSTASFCVLAIAS
jgi:hypothetical protein